MKASVVKFEVFDWDRLGRDVLLGRVDINTGVAGAARPASAVLSSLAPVTLFPPVSLPPNKTVRFQASLEDANNKEFGADLFVEIRKEVSHAVPTEAFDPDSKVSSLASCAWRISHWCRTQLQTIANRMTLAKLELHNLKTAIEKRKKRAAEKVSLMFGGRSKQP